MTATTKPTCPICRDRGVFARWSIHHRGPEPRHTFEVEPDEHEAVIRNGRDVTPEGVPYWAPGNAVRYESSAWETTGPRTRSQRWTETAPCSCTATRSAYDQRKAARADRREERAEALAAQAEADIRRASDMLPDFGQPILSAHGLQ